MEIPPVANGHGAAPLNSTDSSPSFFPRNTDDSISPTAAQMSVGIGLAVFVIQLFLVIWEKMKSYLLFWFFDQEEAEREKLLGEFDAFYSRTVFDQRPSTKVKMDDAEMLSEFNNLNPKIKKGILDEMVRLLKEFGFTNIREIFPANSEDESYRLFAKEIMNDPQMSLAEILDQDGRELHCHIFHKGMLEYQTRLRRLNDS